MNDGNTECLFITFIFYNKKLIVEKLLVISSRLYYTMIKLIEPYVVVNQKFHSLKYFIFWHNMLGHIGSSMMRRII